MPALKKRFCISLQLFIIVAFALFVPPAGVCFADEKVGVVILSFGMDEKYKLDWLINYQDHLYPIFPPGMLAGGHLEGGDCYTLIHFADEVEAAICSDVIGGTVSIGTPIDALCNTYTNTDEYPVHSMLEHQLFGPAGYFTTCSSDPLSFFLSLGHTTIDPDTGNEITGPHVDDPEGSGIGIADFHEMLGFENMRYHYYLKGYRDPYRRQMVRWALGNSTPDYYGYEPDAIELTNIQDELDKALIGTGTHALVRVAPLTYLHNRDRYGNELSIPESAENVFSELIREEQVDRIIVLGTGSHFSNITAWGYCWQQENGEGLSRVQAKTYYDCINDLEDGYGPDTARDLETLLIDKPWRQHASPYPLLYHLAANISPATPLTFADAYGDFRQFNEAALELLKYTLSKYQISSAASLKVILAVHGYAGGYLRSAECDSYFTKAEALSSRVAARIESYLGAEWSGAWEVATAANEFAQPSFEGLQDDPPGPDQPMGAIMSTGEHIDKAINGSYVNELGSVVDNGNSNFDVVIVIPLSWDADNVDTISHFRHETLGNHALQEAQGQKAWLRQGWSEDGDEYQDGVDFDSEYFTVKRMDGSGWKSLPAQNRLFKKSEPVGRGSAQNPTTVILTGSFLSLSNGPTRAKITEAAVASILEAIQNPAAGGRHDTVCETKALNDVLSFSAAAGSRSVKLTWKTTSEIESRGFDLYRSESVSGQYVKITDTPIVPAGSAAAGATYTHIDKNLSNRTTYYYKIEHRFAGQSSSYGPVSATPSALRCFGLF